MHRINPFDNLHFKQGLGQTGEINPLSNVDEPKTQNAPQETQGVAAPSQVNEDDYVDTSAMVDDTGDFDTSDFNFENDDSTDEISSPESRDDSTQNQNNQNNDDIQEQAEELVSELLEKQNQ